MIEDESHSNEPENQGTDFEALIKAEMDEKARLEAAASAASAAVAAVANKDKIYFKTDLEEKIPEKIIKKSGQSILETIIQSELNTVNSRLGSLSYIKKDYDFCKEEIERLKKEEVAASALLAQQSAVPPPPPTIQEAPTETKTPESLSLLLCEETIPGRWVWEKCFPSMVPNFPDYLQNQIVV